MRTALVVLALSLAGCPAKTERATGRDASAACAHVGQTCELSPGKLGSCVDRDECASPPCLVCQSQH